MAERAGFALAFRDDCDATQCDVRWGSHPTTCAGAQHGHFSDVLAPKEVLHCSKSKIGCLGSFSLSFDRLWTVLQVRLAYARNHTKSKGPLLRVALPLLHGTHSPLAYSCVLYHEECLAVMQHLRLAEPALGKSQIDAYKRSRWQSEGWSHCKAADVAYAFIRNQLTAGLNGSRTYVAFDGSGIDWSMPRGGHPLAEMAKDIFSAATASADGQRPKCLHVNLVFEPTVRESEEELAQQAHNVFRAVAPGVEIRLSLPRNGTGQNLLEMHLALSSALLVTEAGTQWSDLLLSWRSLAKLPTAVMRYERSGLDVQVHGGPSRPPCTNTFRSLCLGDAGSNHNMTHHAEMIFNSMAAEASLCSEREPPLCKMRPRDILAPPEKKYW